MKCFKSKKSLVLIGCTALIISFLLYKPAYIAIYKWKEPHFIMPIFSKNDALVLRNDKWGEGHFGAERKNGRLHKGIDIKVDIGTTVYAARSGRAFCSFEPHGMGKYVEIVHPDGFRSIYGHLKDYSVRSNSWVKQGQPIGLVGKSGNAAVRGIKPHLHFEIRNGNKAINPLEGYLTKNEN